jgi:phosphatidylserine/phosphatidylglycerophosphate/cardiolipin synthase-like enzyme
MSSDFQVMGDNDAAPFTLKLHRGEGMALLAMNWRHGTPSPDFVGFAISYREPNGDRDFVLPNRFGFDPAVKGKQPTTVAPIQKFRWVHFPRQADLDGAYRYTVTPVFMNPDGTLSYGEPQRVAVELRRETHPGQLNVAFTRGFVSSQAFVDRYQDRGAINTLLPTKADQGLDFSPTHQDVPGAFTWMGFEARDAILRVLDDAIADTAAQVKVIAYDINQPDILERLELLGRRLRVIVDDSGTHGRPESPESSAAKRLRKSAGAANVVRQHMGGLQHNKTIVVDSPTTKTVVCGSTNFTWRGFFVQNNNALVLHGQPAVDLATAAFESYLRNSDDVAGFAATPPAGTGSLGLDGIDAEIAFSPHAANTALLDQIADDIGAGTTSSVLYSLAFLAQTKGTVRAAIKKVTEDDDLFVYGIADHPVDGIEIHRPDGNLAPVFPARLVGDIPAPFRPEPSGGSGVRLHHKFVVIDFDKPTARVYTGSYNFSDSADTKNGENLVLIRDQRVAVAYMIEALRIFDHYRFRVRQNEADATHEPLALKKPPAPGQPAWWDEYYTNRRKLRDRELFA